MCGKKRKPSRELREARAAYRDPDPERPRDYRPIEETDYIDGHKILDGKVWINKEYQRDPGDLYVWWKVPTDTVREFNLTGTREGDKRALGLRDDDGLTWHHCADWRPNSWNKHGTCTMQLVPTEEHKIGHKGGASLAGYDFIEDRGVEKVMERLRRMFRKKLTSTELYSIANELTENTNIQLDLSSCNKVLFLKWLHGNWNDVASEVHRIYLKWRHGH
ncbi:hypothetical protein AGMMS50229_13940 [Campylobacterota bacterium]|nr:hypothetical protein AGMMS50229_13940 [Campylobacterota bacterium]